MSLLGLNRQEWSWAWYDWANSAFATTVMAGLFPVFYKTYWHSDSPTEVSTFYLGLFNALASLLVALTAPFLGAMADALGKRKGALVVFASLGLLSTCGLYLVAQGHWLLASLLYVTAIIGFSGSNIFYDSLLIFVSPKERRNRLSSIGFALGYLGGGLLFAVNVWMIRDPTSFGLVDATQAVRVAFLTVAVWWGLFLMPLLIWVKEPACRESATNGSVLLAGWHQVIKTLRAIRRLPEAFVFLLAYWLYIDGVDTIIRMAVDYGLSLGFSQNSLITALLITQFVGFPAALVFGKLGSMIGARPAILIGLLFYCAITLWGAFMQTEAEFYGLAISVGLVQGGIQALSRALYSRLIPPDQASEFFGFYNLLGKFAAVLGPLMIGTITLLTENPRIGIVSILVLFISGGWLLTRVDIEKGEREANPS